MMQENNRSFSQMWIEYWGKRRTPISVSFPEKNILIRGDRRRVSSIFGATFFNAAPNVYLVLTTPEGSLLAVRGGYNRLEPGSYLQNYVDKRIRTDTLPEITETTLDGAKISVGLAVSYNVTDPIKAMGLDNPINTLFSHIQFDAREFIKKHLHDDLLGRENALESDQDGLTQYIVQQHNKHHDVARVFTIVGVSVQRQGDPKLLDIRLQDRQNTAILELDQKIQGLEQQIAQKEAEVRKTRAQAEMEIQKIEAEANAEIQKIKNELEKERRAWQHQQDLDMSISHVLEKMLTIPGYHPNTQELTLLYNRFSQDAIESPSSESAARKIPSEIPEQADPLTKTLLTLLNRRKPNP